MWQPRLDTWYLTIWHVRPAFRRVLATKKWLSTGPEVLVLDNTRIRRQYPARTVEAHENAQRHRQLRSRYAYS
jgi:hypothetical protein